jgi:REP element-mobilizing transposase RayT
MPYASHEGGASSATLRELGRKTYDASMTTNRTRPERRSPRLPGRNYAQASGYLVTAMVDDRTHRFGEVIDGVMVQNAAGRLIQSTWLDLAERFPAIALDAFVVMPNHVHGIVFIGTDPDLDPPSLSRVMQVFKSMSAVEYGRGIQSGTFPPVDRALWQRSFHDRSIVSTKVLEAARQYVAANPTRWWAEREAGLR